MLLFNLNYEAKKCLLHQGRFNQMPVEAEAVFRSWIDGFFSALNMTLNGKNDYSMNVESIARVKFVRRYCEENPTDNVNKGVLKLFEKINEVPLHVLTK